MGDRGWFALSRGGWLWSLSPGHFRVALELIRLANFKPTKLPVGGEVITVPRGSLVTSRSALALSCGVSEKVVRGAITRFKTEGMLVTKRAGRGARAPSLFCLQNFERWQSASEEGAGERANKGPTKGQQRASQGARSEQVTKNKEQDLRGSPRARDMGESPEVSDQDRAIEIFSELYAAHARGERPTWGIRQLGLLDQLLTRHGLEAFETRARRLFHSPPDWLKPPFTLATLHANWDRLVDIPGAKSRGRRTGGPTPEALDLIARWESEGQ